MSIPVVDFVLQRALDQKWLGPAQLESAAAMISRQPGAIVSSGRLVAQLIADGALTAWQVTVLRGESFGIEVVDLRATEIPGELRECVPVVLARRHHLVPIARTGEIVRVAVSDPFATEGVDAVAELLGARVEIVLAPIEEIRRAIDHLYGEPGVTGEVRGTIYPDRSGSEEMTSMVREDDFAAGDDTAVAGDDAAPVIKCVHDLISAAIDQRASDIHLEPLEKRFRVRHRIDGLLVETSSPPAKSLQLAIISRVKIMANISIAEKRVPQDGRIQLRHGSRVLDLRVSSLPTVHGESVVMRILDQQAVKLGLGELGFDTGDQALMAELIGSPDGVVLVTGPTGSGKTTTLYGFLHHLNTPDRKIITVEDPVEFQLSGINQVPVRSEIGMTFGAALRAMLRQAPNVIMVGEIRDLETAEIAINASLTGHLVFSTLHTNDAPGAVARLIDLGVKPFLVAASLRAVLAQRLVRKLCPHCRRAYSPSAAELEALGWDATLPGERFMRAVGCGECDGLGYRGRIGIFEIVVINEEIQQLIHERAGPVELRARARLNGMRSLREDGARKVSAGLTTIEEVLSITVSDAR
ncbi:MAG: type fimbrial assembly protein PilB [Verrucomicrobia bacterium]|nr:type fimbrial assembly protein PilB [Verrucomicrobiota bacterium]